MFFSTSYACLLNLCFLEDCLWLAADRAYIIIRLVVDIANVLVTADRTNIADLAFHINLRTVFGKDSPKDNTVMTFFFGKGFHVISRSFESCAAYLICQSLY